MPRELPIQVYDNGYERFSPAFAAIPRAISACSHPEQPIYIHGHFIHEVWSALGTEYAYITVNKDGESFGSLIKPFYRGRSKIHRRLAAFLHRYEPGPDNLVQRMFEGDVRGALKIVRRVEETKPRRYITSLFVETRSKRTGGDVELAEQMFDLIMSYGGYGPFVIRGGYPNLSDLLSIWIWENKLKRGVPMVILKDSPPNRPVINLFERDYWPWEDVIFTIKSKVEGSSELVDQMADLWARTVSREDRELLRRGIGTAEAATRLLRFIREFDPAELESGVAIPVQRPAPLAFREVGGAIGLLRLPTPGLSIGQASGASRALSSLVDDVVAVGGLDNAIPNWRRKLERIQGVLGRLASREWAEESDVVELGVEVTAFESRVHEERSRIGGLTIGEVLTFLFEARAFLEKFPAWVEYENATPVGDTVVTRRTAEEALNILRQFAGERGLLTEEASTRVREFVGREEPDMANPITAEGYSSSAENLTAAAAQSYVDAMAGDPGQQPEQETREELAKRVIALFERNSDSFVRFATARGAKWFDLFVEYVSSL